MLPNSLSHGDATLSHRSPLLEIRIVAGFDSPAQHTFFRNGFRNNFVYPNYSLFSREINKELKINYIQFLIFKFN